MHSKARSRFWLSILSLLQCVSLFVHTAAFWDVPHIAIAELARRHLSSGTEDNIQRLLESEQSLYDISLLRLPFVASWADTVKKSTVCSCMFLRSMVFLCRRLRQISVIQYVYVESWVDSRGKSMASFLSVAAQHAVFCPDEDISDQEWHA